MNWNNAVERWCGWGVGVALPLAVIRCSGWLGLAAQLLAIAGAAALLQRSSHESTTDFSEIEFPEEETRCVLVRSGMK